MKKFNFKYIYVFLFTLGVFYLTGTGCDDDESVTNPSDTQKQAFIGKWVSNSEPEETDYLLITSDSIKVWVKEDVKTSYNLLFSSGYSATSDSLTILNTNDGKQVVKYTISNDSMTVVMLDNNEWPDKLIFTKMDFDTARFSKMTLVGTWQDSDEDSEYVEVVDEDTYQIWKKSGDCYNKNVENDYSFDKEAKTGTVKIDDADGGKGQIKYKQIVDGETLIVTYTQTSRQEVASKLNGIFEVTKTYLKVVNIDFEGKKCQ